MRHRCANRVGSGRSKWRHGSEVTRPPRGVNRSIDFPDSRTHPQAGTDREPVVRRPCLPCSHSAVAAGPFDRIAKAAIAPDALLRHASLLAGRRPPGVGFQLPRDDLRPRAPDVAQGVEDGVGEPRMAARASSEANDRIVVPYRRHRLDDLRRRRSLEFVEQGLPRPGVAAQPERDRRRAPVHGRSVGEARVKTVSGNICAGREREGRSAHRGAPMVEERGDERRGQGEPGGCGGLQRGRQQRGPATPSTVRSAGAPSAPPRRRAVRGCRQPQAVLAAVSRCRIRRSPARALRAPEPPPGGSGRRPPSRPPRRSMVPRSGLVRPDRHPRGCPPRGRGRTRWPVRGEWRGSTPPRSANRSNWCCSDSWSVREARGCAGSEPVSDRFIAGHRLRWHA